MLDSDLLCSWEQRISDSRLGGKVPLREPHTDARTISEAPPTRYWRQYQNLTAGILPQHGVYYVQHNYLPLTYCSSHGLIAIGDFKLLATAESTVVNNAHDMCGTQFFTRRKSSIFFLRTDPTVCVPGRTRLRQAAAETHSRQHKSYANCSLLELLYPFQYIAFHEFGAL